jgi:hypothetical protein
MAVGANCTTVAPPRFVGRLKRNSADVLSEIVDRARLREESMRGSKVIQERKGAWAVMGQQRAEEFAEIVAGGMHNVMGYLQRKGLVQANDEGRMVGIAKGIDSSDIVKNLAVPLSAMKVFIEMSGGGIREAASHLQTMVRNGEDPLQEALAFAKELKAATDAGVAIIGLDQQLGRGLAVQRAVLPTDDAIESLAGAGPSWMRGGNPEQDFALMAEGSDKLSEIIAKLNDPSTLNEGLDDLLVIARRAQLSDSPLETFRLASSITIARSAWDEVWINGLLSSPRTMITNALSFTYAVSRPVMQYIPAKLMEFAARGLGMDGLGDVSQLVAAEAVASLQAMKSSAWDAFQISWRGAVSEQDIYKPLAGQSELVLGRSITSKNMEDMLANSHLKSGNLSRLFNGRSQLTQSEAAVIDTVGRVVRVPTAAMLASDLFIKHLSVRGEVAALGVRRAAKEGVDLRDTAKVQQYIEAEGAKAFHFDGPEAESMLKKWAVRQDYEGLERVRVRAAENTFQEENQWAAMVTEAREKVPFIKPFVPFVKTPLNIIRAGWNATGAPATFGALKAMGENPLTAHLRIASELAKDPAKSFEQAGQIATMSALLTWAWTSVHDGTMTSGGPGRWAEGGRYGAAQRTWQNMMQATGQVPYSIKVGDSWVPFDRFGEPFSLWMKMATDIAHLSSEMDDATRSETAAAWVTVGLTGLYNASFLTGVNDLVEAVRGKNLGAIGQNVVATQTPFGGLLAFIRGAVDPYRSDYYNGDLAEVLFLQADIFGNGLLGKMANRIPGAGTAPQMIDQVVGQPVPLYPGHGRNGLNPLQMAVPVFPRGEPSGDRTWDLIYKIQPRYVESKSAADEVLSPQERQEWNGTMARATINGLTFAQWIQRFASRADVQAYMGDKALTAEGVRTAIDAEFSAMKGRYRDRADQLYFQGNASARGRAMLLDAADQSYKRNNVEEGQRLKREAQELLSVVERQR